MKGVRIAALIVAVLLGGLAWKTDFFSTHEVDQAPVLGLGAEAEDLEVNQEGEGSQPVALESQHEAAVELESELQTISMKAAAGDAEAMYRYYQVMGLCGSIRISEGVASTTGRALPAIPEGYESHCKEVLGESYTAAAAIEESYRLRNEAASAGNLSAGLLVISNPGQPGTRSQRAMVLERVLDSGDPEALFEYGQSYVQTGGSDVSSLPPGLRGSDDFSMAIWTVAACRAGSRSCSAGSEYQVSRCLTFGACSPGGYEAFLMSNFVPPARQQEFNALVSHILELRGDR